MKRLILILIVAGGFLMAPGCYYDKYEEVYPGAGLFINCDTTSNVSYSQHIKPIFDTYCNSCHASSIASGSVVLDTYSGAQTVALTGQLVGATWSDPNYTAMPPTFDLDSCYLKQIKRWVDNGAPNN